ncbi:MAG: serine kinase [Bacteroidales bacterium]|nr:serine kinase [Bacteroidales bacterium]
MLVSELKEKLNLKVFGGNSGLNREITGGYTSDLLSDVMGFADQGKLWITLQTHRNVMAIASLKDLSAILLVKGQQPDADMLELAEEEGIAVLGSDENSFEVSGKVFNSLMQKS